MVSRLGFAALASLLVLGCSGTSSTEQQWVRQGATPEDVKRDLFWCSAEVPVQSRAMDTPGSSARPRSEVRVDDECMESRGYKKGPRKG